MSPMLAVAALTVSMGTSVGSFAMWRLTDRRSWLPVLVFVLGEDGVFVLRNIGNGPASNITVARRARHDDPVWREPTTVAPLGREQQVALTWWPTDCAELTVIYQDCGRADRKRPGRFYTASCSHNVSSVGPGGGQTAWQGQPVRAHWQRLAALDVDRLTA